MLARLLRSAGIAAMLAASAAFVSPSALAQKDPQTTLSMSETTLANFLRDPDMDWLQRNFGRAKGVLISPEIVKAGFIFGGSGGRGVVYAKDAGGKWHGPVFYNLATASVGFQAGIAVSEGVGLVMTEKGLNSLLATSVKLGGDASVAAGPIGAGAKSDVVADIVTFSRSKGVYGGLNFDGTVMTAADDWNQQFYGKKVLPPDVLVRGTVKSPAGDKLATQLNAAAMKK